VLTGAGCGTESGIPDCRDTEDGWKRKPPVMLQDFLRNESTRMRYWVRGLIGWPQMLRTLPSAATESRATLYASLGAADNVAAVDSITRLNPQSGTC
jgi:NAD-dependent SIR2 family protein deacetylase